MSGMANGHVAERPSRRRIGLTKEEEAGMSDRPKRPYRPNRIDIGSGHEISYYTRGGDVRHVGLIHSHLKEDGSLCSGGSILFDLPQNADFPNHAKWQVISEEPLTLSPSLLCRICGSHGWIRDGVWVAASTDRMGVCANCGCRIYRTATGAWVHCYTVSDRCESGKKIMAGHGG
jgi:hypothetical protein